MKWTEYFIPTLRENPKGAEAPSHKLMLRAGLIRKLAAGIYSYLPMGLKVLRNIENIIRMAMDDKGALEIFLPALQPDSIWQKSGRDKTLVDDIGFSFKDRAASRLILGPTHEEVITDLASSEIQSYRQLPLILYQIQTKFRDEPRPRFGVIRSKEFIMKDAYSFDKDEKGLDINYKKMYEAYCEIMKKCQLSYVVVEASPGMMGGKESAEFMIPTESGEDKIAYCKKCGYAASLEAATCLRPDKETRQKQEALKEIDTPATYTVDKVSKLLNVSASQLVKTLIYKVDNKFVAVLIRGDKLINETKLKEALGAEKLSLANKKEIEEATGAPIGFAGPVGLKNIEIIADYQIANMSNFITGANKKDKHLLNVNSGRDLKIDAYYDIRYIDKDDGCPKCKAKISIIPTMEIGHIFKLGSLYSKSFKANFLNKDGKEKPIIMGCYGIGVNRVLAAIIELHHDKNGIIWPLSVAPFKILVLNIAKDDNTYKVAKKIYEDLETEGISVLFDDRDIPAGVKFKDADLIGMPYQIIIGPKNLRESKVEVRNRKSNKKELIDNSKVLDFIKKRLTS